MLKERQLYEGIVNVEKKTVKKRRSVWFWIMWQLANGVVFVGLHIYFHIRAGWLLPFQWTVIGALYYWQIKSARLTGMEIITAPGPFRKWDLVAIRGAKARGIIFKTAVHPDGYCIMVYLFYPSRLHLVNRFKILIIKFAVWARLIN